MKVETKKFAGFVKIMLDVLFYFGIATLIILPFLRNTKFDVYQLITSEYTIVTVHVMLYLGAITVVYVLYELRKIFKSIKLGDPFTSANITSLYRMGFASFLLSIVIFIKLFVFRTFLTYFVFMVLIIAGCFSWTLSTLFREAKRVKDENDLTI